MKKIAIVGGGAAGIYAAIAVLKYSIDSNIQIDLYERNRRIGIKILISGGGKCNITHNASPKEIEDGFIPMEARFLRYALNELTPQDVINFLSNNNLQTITRPNGRVFPKSNNAEDVLLTFENYLFENRVNILTNNYVNGLVVENNKTIGININGKIKNYECVIVTTGGKSYSKTGTTGDGIYWAEELGLKIVKVRPALAPIYFIKKPPSNWQGVSIRDGVLFIDPAKIVLQKILKLKTPISWRDDFLLTHKGISGPSVLEISRSVAYCKELISEYKLNEKLFIYADLVPDKSFDELNIEWANQKNNNGKIHIKTFVERFVPNAIAPYLLESGDINLGTIISVATKLQRDNILRLLKKWEIGEVQEVDLERGEVTAGGIDLNEINRITMESKKISGLFFAGEALDLAGRVGGYNLQAAFSSGFIAGRSAVELLKKQ